MKYRKNQPCKVSNSTSYIYIKHLCMFSGITTSKIIILIPSLNYNKSTGKINYANFQILLSQFISTKHIPVFIGLPPEMKKNERKMKERMNEKKE